MKHQTSSLLALATVLCLGGEHASAQPGAGGMSGMAGAVASMIVVLVLVAAGISIAAAALIVRRTRNRHYWWLVPVLVIVLPYSVFQLMVRLGHV